MDGAISIIDYDEVLPDYMGAMQRLELAINDPMTMDVIVQRVLDGESLKAIAKSWKLPVTRFIKWVSSDDGRLHEYESALRIRADEAINEAIEISDQQHKAVSESGKVFDPEVPRDKLRIDTRLKIAALWDKERFGGEKGLGGSGINIIINRDGVLSKPEEVTDNTVVIDG